MEIWKILILGIIGYWIIRQLIWRISVMREEKKQDLQRFKEMEEKEQEAIEKQKKQEFITCIEILFAEKIITSEDVENLMNKLANTNLEADILFEAYGKEIEKLALEYLSIFLFEEEKSHELEEKIKSAISSISDFEFSENDEEENYHDLIKRNEGILSIINVARSYKNGTLEFDNSITLKPKEVFNYSAKCSLYDNSKGREIGKLIQFNTPSYVSREGILSGYITETNLLEKGKGIIILTNQRIVFTSSSVTRQLKYEDIISISAGINAVQITREAKAFPEVFRFSDAYYRHSTQLFISILLDILNKKQLSKHTTKEEEK